MREPKGQLVIQTLAMPVNTNSNGDIFGGWILSQMDLGAGILARQISKTRCVTVAIDSLVFRLPVKVGDTLSCYAELFKTGRSSMHIKIEAWKIYQETLRRDLVTEGVYTFVALNEKGKAHPADPIRRNEELKKAK